MTHSLDVNVDLLDRRVVDADGQHVGRVDDLALDLEAEGGPEATHLLLGAEALGGRLGRRLGDVIASLGRVRIGRHEPIAIPVDRIAEIGNVVRLSVSWDEIPAVRQSERWFAEHLIGRIPGGHRAVE